MKEMKNKKNTLNNNSNCFEPLPIVGQVALTGTALPNVTIFLREEYSMLSTGSDFTIDSNDKNTRQILHRHISQFEKAWETLAQK